MEAYLDSEDSSDHDRSSYPLHDAAEAGDTSALTQLLSKPATDGEFNPAAGAEESDEGPNVNERDEDGCTPLHVALLSGHVECAEVLLAAGASTRRPCEGSPPLHLATCIGGMAAQQQASLRAVQLLLQAHAPPHDRDDHGRTALHWAAVHGLVEVAQALLLAAHAAAETQAQQALQDSAAADAEGQHDMPQAQPPLLECQDKQGNSPLHLAARFAQHQMVSLLVRQGEAWSSRTVVTAKNKAGQLPLHLAAVVGCWQSAAALQAAAPASASATDKRGLTAAQWAAKRGHQDLAAVLTDGSDLASTSRAAAAAHTLLVAPRECLEHHTCPEPMLRGQDAPPENANRLRVLMQEGKGILRSDEFRQLPVDEASTPAPLADILRVHEWNYVLGIQRRCAAIPDNPAAIGHLDGDTAISRGTFGAALAAAGAVCRAIDRVMAGEVRNAFCAIRPPGHHAGPTGVVTCTNDPHGSHGFCLLNNMAIGGAYATSVYRHAGIKKVAILDFDVHHGNGTQACVSAVMPTSHRVPFSTPFSKGVQEFTVYRPWMGEGDADNILFASVQGYGKRSPHDNSWVYPASGANCDSRRANPATAAAQQAQQAQQAADSAAATPASDGNAAEPSPSADDEFAGDFEQPSPVGPRIINVGIPGPGANVALWRRAWRDKILPAVADFAPDLILISAGFDAHKKDDINFRFIGIQEKEYEWLTDQIVQVANKCCQGRIVSALEGGYRIQGGLVSAFARSVAAHVQALKDPNFQVWDEADARWERQREEQRKQEQEAARKAAAEEAQARAAADAHTAPRGAAAPDEAGAVPAASADGAAAEPDRKRRRRGGQVDYVALNAMLEAEAGGAAAATTTTAVVATATTAVSAAPPVGTEPALEQATSATVVSTSVVATAPDASADAPSAVSPAAPSEPTTAGPPAAATAAVSKPAAAGARAADGKPDAELDMEEDLDMLEDDGEELDLSNVDATELPDMDES
ncbi:hypothetical protein WJX72_007747 [[Myrmecia] bisecta]|uniref:Histone deacetylase domain-containing protein n=1 Tax=[Myrmecia] bisecta TaxID=41462 RepID=A0AAW1PKF5_9CHLO